MNKIKCVETNGYKLTIDKEYNLLDERDDFYYLINDNQRQVKYHKRLFNVVEEEVVPEVPARRTEQDMINSIQFNNNVLTFVDLDGNTITLRSNLQYGDSLISCGIGQCYGIYSLLKQIEDAIPDTDDYLELHKAIITTFVSNCIINKTSKVMWLVSTNLNETDEDYYYDGDDEIEYLYTQEVLETLNSLAGTVSEDVVNPNSDNTIRMWVFYTDRD